MTLRPRLLFCDIDRTLLTQAHALLPKVAQAIRRAEAAGIRVVLASARSPVGVRRIQHSLGLDGPAICFNGAWSGTPGNRRPWYGYGLDRQTALSVIDCARAAGLAALWYGTDTVYALEPDASAARWQAAVTQDCLDLVNAPSAIPEDPFKIMLVARPEDLAAAQFRLAAACGGTVSITRSGPDLLEVVRKGVNKAVATAQIAARLGLTPADCAAAGDSENDIDMLRWAGLPLTVANGVEAARRLARFTGGHCDAGGLAGVIDWLLSRTAHPRPPTLPPLPDAVPVSGRTPD